MFGRGKKTDRTPVCVVAASDSDDRRTLGRFIAGEPDTLYRCEESDRIADGIIKMAKSLAKKKHPGETISVALLSDHPTVYFRQILLSLAMRTDERKLSLGVADANRFEFTKL